MIIALHKNFEKQYKKLKQTEKKRFKERRDLFLKNEFDSVLNNHPLKGSYLGYRSINITGDLRALYKKEGDVATFFTINSHSNLYS